MNSMVLVIAILLASHAVNSSPILNYSWETPKHYCGSQLANILAMVCQGVYNQGIEDVTVSSLKRKKRQPIVQECCENTCTLNYLKSYCNSGSQRIESRSEKPLVDINPKSQKNPMSNTLPQRQNVVNNNLLVESTIAKTKSNSIISNSKENVRETNINYNTISNVPKKEPVIGQDLVPGRVKTVTPYFDKMPSVIITKTQH